MSRTNHLRTKLANHQPCRGVWLSLPGLISARLLAHLPVDWLVVDTEHAPIDVPLMAQMVAAIADANGPAPLVRVPQASVENIKYALDAGAWGIIAPMINSRAEAEQVVAAAKYPPLGQRSYGGAVAGLAFGLTMIEYQRQANDQTLVIVQIENQAALAHLDEIFSVPGLDMAFVGPMDLSISLGLDAVPEQTHPIFQEALNDILAAGRAHRLPVGIYCSNARAAAARIRQGFLFVNVAHDVGALLRGVQAELDVEAA
jgi:4-hydroxy-2-oxoheptanedioate aldolase